VIGYTPAEQAIRAALGHPPATGADEPPAWHDQPRTWTAYDARAIQWSGASGAGLPDGAIYGPAPAAPDDAAAVTPGWWRP
jgi:hypothetical protein